MIFKFIKSAFLIIILIILIVLIYPNLYRKIIPCNKPITYSIGTFDKQFGISRTKFLEALVLAETVWEKPIGKELFVYAPEGGKVAVSLIYDSRQETTQTLSSLEGAAKEGDATYKSLQTKYNQLKADYLNIKSAYELRVKEFNQHNATYETQVEAWNSSKRNSREQFEELEQTRIALEKEASELKALEGQFNEIVRQINMLVGTLNRIAKSLNLNVETYNTIGASRGETFTGGVYYSEEGEEGINIYEFSSQDKLVRVLAHELGHALGLEHNDDPQAIMYHLNEGDRGALSEADLAALQALCYTKDIIN